MNREKLRIGVFMGGRSIEREVSFNSGRTICDHLDTQRYEVIPLFQTEAGDLYVLPQHFLHRGKIADFFHRLDGEAERVTWDGLKKLVDFVYLAVHGRFGEDGTIQGMLEVLNIPYLGAKVLGSALGMDKIKQKVIMQANGIDVARGITLSPFQIATSTTESLMTQLAVQGVTLPVIVKPAHEGSSLGIAKIDMPEDLLDAVRKASTTDSRRTQSVLVEECLVGMEWVCVCLQKVHRNHDVVEKEWFTLPITEVVIEANSDLFDYEQKYMPGRALKLTPARCSQQDQERITAACVLATKVLQFSTISRIDGFLTTDGRVVLIDPNSLTGMSPSTFIFHQAAEHGMSHTDLINFLIENELKAYGIDAVSTSMHKGATMASEPQRRTRVAVLLGGDSNEREISLESGRNICYKLSPHKYEVQPIFVNDSMELFKLDQRLLIKNATRTIADKVTPEIQIQWSDLPNLCDFVFLGLHGGKGEGGAVQGVLEMLDLPYNGSGVLASALCMDKYGLNNFLRSQGFEVPFSVLVHREEWMTLQPEQRAAYLNALMESANLRYPLILKPHDDGCSVMVSKIASVTELIDGVNAFFAQSAKQAAMLEELVVGFELTCGVIGNDTVRALPPSMAVAKGGILSIAEKFLPGEGENQTPAPLPAPVLAKVQKVMEESFVAVGCKGYARIDCFYQDAQQSPTGKERVVILEFNTLPGMTPATCIFHQAAEVGMRPMELIDKIVEFGFELHRRPATAQQVEKQPAAAPASDTTAPRPVEDNNLTMKLF